MNVLSFAPMIVSIAIAVLATFLYISSGKDKDYRPYMYGTRDIPPYVNLMLVYGICAFIAWMSLPLMMEDPSASYFHLILLLGSYAFFAMSIFLAQEEKELMMLEYYGLESGTKIVLAVVVGCIGLGAMMGVGMILTLIFNIINVQQGNFLSYGMNTITLMETSTATAMTSKLQQLLFVTLNSTAEEFLMGVLAVVILMMTVSHGDSTILGLGKPNRSMTSRLTLLGVLVVVNILIATMFAALHFGAYDWSWEIYAQLAINRLILTGLFCLWGFAERGSDMYWGIIACITAHAGWNAILVIFV